MISSATVCCSQLKPGRRTCPVVVAFKARASASHPTMRPISCVKALTSRALAFFDRTCASLARRQGCWDRCAFGGSCDGIISRVILISLTWIAWRSLGYDLSYSEFSKGHSKSP